MELLIDLLLNPWFIISFLFWGIVGIAVYILRNKKDAVYVFFPLLAMFKTKKLNNIIRRISRKVPRFWRIFWTIGIFISFSFTIYALWFFFVNFIELIFRPQITNVVTPLIPGVTIDLPSFSYLILPLLFIMTTHELAHGISANVDGLEVKSSGILGAGVFFIIGFGAFVEVDERKLRSSKFKRSTRLRVATSGTFVNAITAAIGLLLLISFPYMIAPHYTRAYQIDNILIARDGGFNDGNLTRGDVIVGIKEGEGSYVYIDYNFGISLDMILSNKTGISCSVGDVLTFLTYNPVSDIQQEKNITLGPRYYYGLELEQYNESAIIVTKIHNEAEGGNNYNTGLEVGSIITKINGTNINHTSGETLGMFLTNFNLKEFNLTDSDDVIHPLNISTTGVYIGIAPKGLYWMHANDFAKLFTPAWPEFLYRTVFWLFAISFSITLFNMLPLPIFDGDRAVKEIINGIVGEGNYDLRKKKKEKFHYTKDDKKLNLSEYRVEYVEHVKIYPKEDTRGDTFISKIKKNLMNSDNTHSRDRNEVILKEDNYSLTDDLGDGFQDTIVLNLSNDGDIDENSIIEVSYEYLQDSRINIKKSILNTIRIITLFIVAGNFILSFVKFGFNLFWL